MAAASKSLRRVWAREYAIHGSLKFRAARCESSFIVTRVAEALCLVYRMASQTVAQEWSIVIRYGKDSTRLDLCDSSHSTAAVEC
jgi:hypothetical protein